jgi:hypothetical protein
MLHYDERSIANLIDLVNRADVGVVQTRSRARFLQRLGPAELVEAREELNGNRTLNTVSRARYTSPIPPRPMSATIS